MEVIELSPWQALRRSLLMVFHAAPKELRGGTIFILLSGLAPSGIVWLNKVVIDQATYLLSIKITENPINLVFSHPTLLASIVGLLLLNFANDSLSSIPSFLIYPAVRDRVQGFVEKKILEKVANFEDIALFETPDLLNLVQLSDKGVQRIKELSLMLIQTLQGVFIFIPAILLSGSLAWWLPLILCCCASPGIYVEIKHRKQSWRIERTQAPLFREMNLYKMVLMGEGYAKELRLFRLQYLLLERWESLFRTINKAMQQLRRHAINEVVGWSLLNGLGLVLPYLYIILGVLGRTHTLGDLALFSGIILQVRRSLSTLISAGTSLYDVALATTPIFQILELQPQLRQQNIEKNSLQVRKKGIQVQDVSFTYPNSTHQILKNIDLTIHPNEMIVLVGENGAGKTTLAKLLCRLYDPTEGKITWNGEDLRAVNLEQLRSRIAVVMQDYARFPTTVRENVAFGYLSKLDDDAAIDEVIAVAGMTKVIEKLDGGLDTILGKQLEGGVDLSGGQWQRLALARALMRLQQAELLVLDEPTANLDPKTEHEIYNIFRTVAKGRTSVIVSHRLGLAKLADKIVVLEHGQIIETGTHDELMALGGQYHLMFTRQASSYN